MRRAPAYWRACGSNNSDSDSDSDGRDRYDSDEHEDGTDGTDVPAKIKRQLV